MMIHFRMRATSWAGACLIAAIVAGPVEAQNGQQSSKSGTAAGRPLSPLLRPTSASGTSSTGAMPSRPTTSTPATGTTGAGFPMVPGTGIATPPQPVAGSGDGNGALGGSDQQSPLSAMQEMQLLMDAMAMVEELVATAGFPITPDEELFFLMIVYEIMRRDAAQGTSSGQSSM